MDTREKEAQRPSNKTGANFWRGKKKKEEELVCHSLSSFRFESPFLQFAKFSATYVESQMPKNLSKLGI